MSDEAIFEDGDIRATTLELMAKAGEVPEIDEKLAVEMGKNYFELRKAAALKFTLMADAGNPFVPHATPVLNPEYTQEATKEYMSWLKDQYDNLVDFLVTVYLLRGMEVLGKVDNPFTIEISEEEG